MKKILQITAMAASIALFPTFAPGAVTIPDTGGGSGGGDTTDPGDVTVEIDPTEPIDPEVIAAGIADSAQLACKENPASCGITLEDILGKVAFGETEPNDFALSADPLTSSLPMSGQLSRQTDADWYVFETTNDNDTITTLFTAQNNSVRLSIKDAQGNLLSSNDSSSGDEFSFDTTLAHAGVYYLVVEPSVADDATFTNAGYQITVFIRSTGNGAQQADFNFHDVETEFNNYFTTADSVVTNLVTEGQIISGRDRDIFRIDTPGNEIIHLELCYPNTSCFNEGSWAMFVYDPTRQPSGALTDAMLDAFLEQCRVDDEGFVTCIYSVDGESTYPGQEAAIPPLYYLTEFGRFDEFWVGNIDPSFGDEYALDIAAQLPGTLYVAIVPVLGRNDAGDIVQNLQTITGGPDVFGVVFEPFSEDQYTFRVSKTALRPSDGGASGAPLARAMEGVRSYYNPLSKQVHVGEVLVGDRIFSADLQLKPWDGEGPLEFEMDLEDYRRVTTPVLVDPNQ